MDLLNLTCISFGAPISITRNAKSFRCTYCGTPYVMRYVDGKYKYRFAGKVDNAINLSGKETQQAIQNKEVSPQKDVISKAQVGEDSAKKTRINNLIILGILVIFLVCVCSVVFWWGIRSMDKLSVGLNSKTENLVCEQANNYIVESLNESVGYVNPSYTIRTAYVVPTNSIGGEDAYFVAAKIFVPGGPSEGVGPGVWLLIGEKNNPNYAFSINSDAQRYTVFPSGNADSILQTIAGNSNFVVSMNHPGAKEAKACAK